MSSCTSTSGSPRRTRASRPRVWRTTHGGRILKGVEPRTSYVPVEGDSVDVYVEAAANPTVLVAGFPSTPLGDVLTAPRDPLYRLAQAELVAVQEEVLALGHDVEVLLGTVTAALEGDPRRARVMTALQDMADHLDVNDIVGTAGDARRRLSDVLAAPANASAHRVSAAGHAHIDSAWLWPVRETIRKCARTFANVLALAEEHDDLRFACSSAQQYAWMQEHYPDLFERIRESVAAGHFVPVGGMWVESDTNLPGGEAMVRQLVHGTRFFREELGAETDEVWLPDSFGYTGSLPQIARLAGKRWFLSQKMSWSYTDAFPHHTFWWEGIDGTRVFTHFPPTDTYNAEVTPAELAHGTSAFKEAGPASRSLLLYGYGDGGGGPTREMVERAHRVADLEGMPQVHLETPGGVLHGCAGGVLRRTGVVGRDVPRVPPRRLHLADRDEAGQPPHRAPAPRGRAVVHARDGAHRRRLSLRRAAAAVARDVAAAVPRHPPGQLDRVGAPRGEGALRRAGRRARDADRRGGRRPGRHGVEPRHLQRVTVRGRRRARDGRRTGVPVPGPAATLTHGEAGSILQNEHLRVEVDARGLVVSVLDLAAGREVLAGPANLLQLHPDTPNRFDAWDIESFATHRADDVLDTVSVESQVLPDGTAELHVVRRSGPSTFDQWVRLAPGSGRVDFETTVDWQHDETLLKVAFPVAVHAERSTSEIGYGHVHRATHANTGWDAARFEICAHRWIHVGEPGYGAALVNSGTYGHDVTRSTTGDRRGPSPTTVRLTLARSPRFPDPDTDRGTHTFHYGLVVGADVPRAVEEGYRFNLPVRSTTGAGPVEPAVRVVEGSAVVEAVKLAEDRSGDVVVRVYEPYGGRSDVLLHAGFDVTDVRVTDLHEHDDTVAAGLAPLEVRDNEVRLTLGPFQIVTLRLTR